MEIIDNKALLLRTRDPSKYSIIPKHKVVGEEDGIYQIAVYWGLDESRVLKNLGEASEVDESTWLMEISNLLNNPTEVSKMSKACLNLNLARRDSQKRLIEIFDQ